MEYITRGSLYNPTFSFKNCDNSAVDLTSSTVKFMIKRKVDDADINALLMYEYENPTTNNLMFEFDDAETSSLPLGDAIGAIKVYYPNGKSEEVWNSDYKIIQGVIND